MARPDAVIICVSQPHLSAGRQRQLAATIEAASPIPVLLVRLEGAGPHLGDALDELAAAGHRTILVQPMGLPFSQSLATWLPGVLAHWRRERGRDDLALLLGSDQAVDATTIQQIVSASVKASDAAEPIVNQRPSLGKPGWDHPPPFKHHLIVCTGPRCHYRGAPNLSQGLAKELDRTGLADDCMVTTTGCIYPCNQGPLLAAYPRGEWYRLLDDKDVARFVDTVIGRGQSVPDLVIHRVAPLDAKGAERHE